MICRLGFEATRIFQILLLATYSASPTLCIKNSRSPNSINPRNLSAIDTSEGKNRCQSRKGIKTLPKSLCRFPCEKDDECVKYGWLGSCCPAIPGSSCKRECLITEDAEFNLTSKTCIDAETRKRYIVGETFIKEDKCCTCRFGGTDCKRVEFCRLGCKKNSRYYRDGEFIPSRSCYNCSCHNGSVACFFDVSCLQGKCGYGGRIYDGGDVLHLKKSCKDCVCTSGRWNCMMLICRAVKSKANLSVLHQDLRSYLTRVAVLTSLLLMQWLLLICSFG